ncbi:acyltransferase [Gordonia rubripertincta]|uniref:DapH/DapD/GlmU-related protein n=1 Tax=Gordonia rubripertincta TaxID=36822 RepID=A0ABT4MXS1_GORRU|nr:DapH/DapD/GlmU-related protein [Gordonia rubripertincta]MCZ4551792.1 DapH/DapD/GlmU-related protein [Gordonia rubripertincta]
MTGTHEIGNSNKRASEPTILSSVVIGDGAWLGAGVLVNPGTTIGPGCVIAPGAVVTRDCEPDGLYAGIPAKRIRELDSPH